jgi:signal transduction histidine kinase
MTRLATDGRFICIDDCIVRGWILASVIERRRSLHKSLVEGQKQSRTLQSQIDHLQPLATIGSASSMIAHEINNLLTPLGNYAELALNHLDDRDLVEKALRKAVMSCQRASKVMQSMMAMAQGRKQDRVTVSLRPLIEDVFLCLARDFTKDSITVKIEVPADLEIHAVPVQLQQVIMNFVLNAREAMLDRGGTLTLRAEAQPDAVVIEVRDTGAGIPAAVLERIFEPFFSTKTSAGRPGECYGTGLGLAFCKTVIESHEGRLCVRSKPGEGTAFVLSLPKAGLGGDDAGCPS